MNAHFFRDCASCGLLYPVHARFLPGATRVGIEEGVVVVAWWMATISGFDSEYTGELRHHHCGGCLHIQNSFGRMCEHHQQAVQELASRGAHIWSRLDLTM